MHNNTFHVEFQQKSQDNLKSFYLIQDRISRQNEMHYFGRFNDLTEAAEAYEKFAIENPEQFVRGGCYF